MTSLRRLKFSNNPHLNGRFPDGQLSLLTNLEELWANETCVVADYLVDGLASIHHLSRC
jgi:hypothetical protein